MIVDDARTPHVTYVSKGNKKASLKVLATELRKHQVVVTFPGTPKVRETLTVDGAAHFVTRERPKAAPQRFYPPERVSRRFRLEGPGCGSPEEDGAPVGPCELVELVSGQHVITVRTCKEEEATCRNRVVTLGKLAADGQYVVETENPMDASGLKVFQYVLGSGKLVAVDSSATPACRSTDPAVEAVCAKEKQRLEALAKRYAP